MSVAGTGSSERNAEAELIARLLATLAERDATLAERDATLAERDATVSALESEKAALESEKAALESEHARLLRAYEALKEELLLVKRRLFVAKAERVDTAALQLEFEELTRKLDALAGQLPPTSDDDDSDGDEQGPESRGDKRKRKPKGRRNLAEADLPEVTVEVTDELFEKLVAEGKAERIGTEVSYKLAHERGGYRRVAMARVKYRAIDARGESSIETAPLPPELIRRCFAAPSTLAHIAAQKLCDGLPLYRQEDISARDGFRIDRGTMCRWLEELGGALGATIIEAAREDAFANAFCIMTDATGFAVQPGPRDGPRRPCRKGHYFVQIADRDHVFFEFTAEHTSRAVRALFKGFEGYVQADAASVYDALFRPSAEDDPDADGCTRREVGCWSHARRKYWEAALAKERVAREALVRIGKVFEIDEHLRGGRRRPAPAQLARLRQQHLRPLVEDFLAFAEAEYAKVADRRGSLRRALGYTVRQADALRAFLEDGRLRLDNNLSEGQLRKVVRIRDASLFAGSDLHAQSAGHILSLIASARMHGLDPERYLRDIIRVLPFWPKDRYLELAPKYWAATRARLDPRELDAEVGLLCVPEPLPRPAE
jgi:transposase